MRLTRDSDPAINFIRGYGPGELRINDGVYRETLIVAASELRLEPGLRQIADLSADHAARILEFEPEVVLIGTGARQSFPAAEFGARFLERGVGFEVMDTGAACRTFNVLLSERRRVVALLLP
jgi:uncharacterized protein